jgi:hypothetical protein
MCASVFYFFLHLGKSLSGHYMHDPNGRVAEAYRQLTKEVLSDEKKRQQAHAQEL